MFKNKFLKLITTLFKLNFQFLPPKKSDVLVYDNMTVVTGYSSIIFKNTNIEVFYSRYEKINLFILIKSIFFFFKFKNLIKNYKFYYFKAVRPKIIME